MVWESVRGGVGECGRWCGRVWEVVWESMGGGVGEYGRWCGRVWEVVWEGVGGYGMEEDRVGCGQDSRGEYLARLRLIKEKMKHGSNLHTSR